jgi:hypothetical protein
VFVGSNVSDGVTLAVGVDVCVAVCVTVSVGDSVGEGVLVCGFVADGIGVSVDPTNVREGVNVG